MAEKQCLRSVPVLDACSGAKAQEQKEEIGEIETYSSVVAEEEEKNMDFGAQEFEGTRGQCDQGPENEAQSSLCNSVDGFPSELTSSMKMLSELPSESARLSSIKDGGELHQDNEAPRAEETCQNHAHSSGSHPSSELSHVYVTPSTYSSKIPNTTRQKLQSVPMDGEVLSNGNLRHALERNAVPTDRVAKIFPLDGYNWRKYGQKQVKSPVGSRSYYRCTYPDCHAKKLELYDLSGGLINLICKGEHNHDPPHKANHVKDSLSIAANNDKVCSIETHTDSDMLPSSINGVPLVMEPQRHNSVGFNSVLHLKTEDDELDSKRRLPESSIVNPSTPIPETKTEFVLHAAEDVDISGDGYRWRKYGQKMVKGNHFPRNYYKCTSAGCPVRKHVERAMDSVDGFTITYKGVHDHDSPVPKRRCGHPFAVAATPIQSMKLEEPTIDTTPTPSPEDRMDGADSMDLGSEKVMESARTLLSIGFEIKPF